MIKRKKPHKFGAVKTVIDGIKFDSKADYDDEGNLIKIVDVKGMQTSGFKIKAKLFANRYGMQITVAKKVGSSMRFDEKVI